MRRKLAAGNWKMNGLAPALAEVGAMAAALAGRAGGPDVLICPPATLLSRMAQVAGPVLVGGQDCHAEPGGAHTGDLSANMLRDAGASHVILGHSERRADHGETDAAVRAKAAAAMTAGLVAIICVGETLAEREAGAALDVVGRQLAGSIPDEVPTDRLMGRLVVAYEPVWAIGTGKVPSASQIGEVHGFMRRELARRFGAEAADAVPLLYGGSVNVGNAAGIFAVADVDGALVGGASLTAAAFLPIVEALTRA